MSSNGGTTLAVKLFIDKEKKRVLFAECDKDFVDILFSFLTLPLGTIVRRLGKQSQIGCLDELYKSVESLGEDHFQTRDCKTMLLRPVNAAAFHCDRLKIKVDDADQTAHYTCYSCSWKDYFSSVSGAICKCGSTMNKIMRSPQSAFVPIGDKADGIFAKSGTKFIVTDDLQVAPSTTTLMFSLIRKLGLQDQANIKEEVLQFNSNMIISLLRRALLSKQPLTGLYFDVAIAPDAATFSQLPENWLTKPEVEVEPKFKPLKIRLVQTKDDSSVYSKGRYYYEMNSKSPSKRDETAYRAYVNGGSINFMVADDLHIVDFSLAKSLRAIRAAKIPEGKLVEKELTLEKTQVLKLLRAAMVTRDVLSSALLPSKKHVTISIATTSTQGTTASGLQGKGPLQLRRSSRRLRKPHSARTVTRLWWSKAWTHVRVVSPMSSKKNVNRT